MSNGTMGEIELDVAFRKFLLVFIGVLSIFFLFLDGYFEWMLGLFVLGLMSLLILSELKGRSSEMSFWKRNDELDFELNMNLKEISEMAERAYHGKKVSKAFLEERIIKEFLNKVKTERDLDKEEVEEILDDEEKLKEIIDDDKITEFILGTKSYTDLVHEKSIHENPDTRWSRLKKKFKFEKETIDEDYIKRIDNILKRMEEWN